jgi:hypothetical protein
MKSESPTLEGPYFYLVKYSKACESYLKRTAKCLIVELRLYVREIIVYCLWHYMLNALSSHHG